jgi:osmotically-inducible protein OsmY
MGLLATAPGITWAGPVEKDPSGDQPAASPTNQNQETAKRIAVALKKARISGKGIALEYKSGNCVITGEAADASQVALATKVIASVDGVQTVDNRMTTPAGSPRAMPASVAQAAGMQAGGREPVQRVAHETGTPSNQEVAQGIADSLSSSGLSGYDIEVRYSNGIATLAGNVDSPMAAQKAQECAYGVNGVQQVTNRLTVNGQPAAPAMPPSVMPTGYPQMAAPQLPAQMAQAQFQGMPTQAPMMAAMQRPGGPSPMAGAPGVSPAGHMVYNQPNLPNYAWPTYAQYDNSAAVTYPSQYDASAWPYIGPYYPYPQVPLGWRKSTLEWDDGSWNLKFNSRTDKWWWFMNPHNWSE